MSLPSSTWPAHFVAEILFAEAASVFLADDVLHADRTALLRLNIGSDVGETAIDLLRRDGDVRAFGLLLFEPIVDDAIEQLLIHLLLLQADDVGVDGAVHVHRLQRRFGVRFEVLLQETQTDLHAQAGGAVQQVGPEHPAAHADDRATMRSTIVA